MLVELEKVRIGVEVKTKNEDALDFTKYFDDLTKATKYAAGELNKGNNINMIYCDINGNRIYTD